ncbi:Tetratricopeptide repeat protein 1 [Porphyridium purpureum]|uniref:Tetratricopeptide repeat protein 1 n=1 Tax=Porphyridium purpureum TaxID=35688 RepID=A0A5J4YTG9_PORPP|nr:Tetratricopeptide repeat protein 1 [Porphyridium purpureum]|eukprot:POR4111..scf227_4
MENAPAPHAKAFVEDLDEKAQSSSSDSLGAQSDSWSSDEELEAPGSQAPDEGHGATMNDAGASEMDEADQDDWLQHDLEPDELLYDLQPSVEALPVSQQQLMDVIFNNDTALRQSVQQRTTLTKELLAGVSDRISLETVFAEMSGLANVRVAPWIDLDITDLNPVQKLVLNFVKLSASEPAPSTEKGESGTFSLPSLLKTLVVCAPTGSGKSIGCLLFTLLWQRVSERQRDAKGCSEHKCSVLLTNTYQDINASAQTLRHLLADTEGLHVAKMGEEDAEVFLDDDDDLVLPDVLVTAPIVLLRLLEYGKIFPQAIFSIAFSNVDEILARQASPHVPAPGRVPEDDDDDARNPYRDDAVQVLDNLLGLVVNENMQRPYVMFSTRQVSQSLKRLLDKAFGSSVTEVRFVPLILAGEVDEDAAMELKKQGNESFTRNAFSDARRKYSMALRCTCLTSTTRAVLYANRAATLLRTEEGKDSPNLRPKEALQDAKRSVHLEATYVKGYARLKMACELDGQLGQALEAARKMRELDATSISASEVARLAQLCKDKDEKDMAQAMSQLKDLGNSLLGKFGLSLDNFNLQQDPTTGSYSMSFKHAPEGMGSSVCQTQKHIFSPKRRRRDGRVPGFAHEFCSNSACSHRSKRATQTHLGDRPGGRVVTGSAESPGGQIRSKWARGAVAYFCSSWDAVLTCSA